MNALVAIPVKDRLDLTKPLVEELLAQGSHVLVMDNGSRDGTPEWLAKCQPPVNSGGLLVWGRFAGKGLHEMWNKAIDMARSRDAHLVLLNNDLELDGKPDWIGRLVHPLDTGEWDAVCPNYDRTPAVTWKGPVLPLRGICANRYDGSGGLAGFAFAVSDAFLRTGYRFPEELKWWYGDNDLVLTLNAQARKYGMVVGVGVTHIGGGSQTAKGHDLSGIIEQDRAAFGAKWGVLL